jgi:hypothetical protein
MIYTRSQFFYGIEITENNNKLDFEESGTLVAEMPVGFYSLEDFAQELAFTLAGETEGLAYFATVDRETRKITLSANGTFSIITNGVNSGISAWSILGFTSNKTGGTSYTSDVAVGKVYKPQFFLQDYVPFENFIESAGGSVKTSASGKTEVVSFGKIRLMECRITFINNYTHSYDSVIETSPTGLADTLDFMNYLISKGNIEFMPDRDAPNTFYQCFLLSTSESSDGISFKLQELYSQNLNGYYDTNKLTFREVN